MDKLQVGDNVVTFAMKTNLKNYEKTVYCTHPPLFVPSAGSSAKDQAKGPGVPGQQKGRQHKKIKSKIHMDDIFSVKGQIALITGSTSGLGKAFAAGLAQRGATVIINGRDERKINLTIKEFTNKGWMAKGKAFDVTNSEQVTLSVKQIEEQIGTIDILVNNAGTNIRGPLESFNDQDWDKLIALNLTGVYKVSKAVVQSMIKKGSGKIINIGSMQSELGRPTIAPYAATKGGVKMLTKGMAVEWARHNIQVNGIGPGYFKTELTKPLYENPDFDQWLCSRTPANRWGDPQELIGALVFLASNASNYMNGQMVYVDGGLLASV
jgi:gluconate 5-dehydrogenase